MPQLMISYENAVVLGPEVVGGKGWNLGRLQRYGFQVPNGGILSAEHYQLFMLEPPLQRMVIELASMSIEALSESKAEALLSTLRAKITATAFPSEVEHTIQTFLLESKLANLPLAIRSSATAEDSLAFSFAGIHESFLNVAGTVEDVLQAIKGCYASLWTLRAIAYRRHSGLADSAVSCAVVICRMITGKQQLQPDAAGVAFSCDPRTGQCDRVTIHAAPGWGTDVVTGTITPEMLTVRPSLEGKPASVERANKQVQVLCDQDASRLVLLVQRIVWALSEGQQAQDIEWVYDGSDFWIVQARPVTHLPRVTFPETASFPTIWSNGNLKDVMPGILTPFSWSIVQPIVNTLLLAPCRAVGYSLPEGLEIIRCFNGRAYFNLTALQWSYYDALGVLPREFNQGLGGYQPEIPLPSQRPLRGRGGIRRLRGRLRLLQAIGKNARTFSGNMRSLREKATQQTHQPLADLTNVQLQEQHQLLSQQGSAFGMLFQLTNMGGVWGDYLIQAIERDIPGQGRSLSSALMAGTRAVVSADHAYQLYKIASAVRNDEMAVAYLATSPRDTQGWRQLSENSTLRKGLTSFLDTFGHRCAYEFELANPRWCEDPTYLLDCLQMFLDAENLPIPYAPGDKKRQSAEAAIARLPFQRRLLISWFARQSRRTASDREAGKSTLVAALQPIREAAREIGCRMVSTHILEEREDVFFLALPEIGAYLQGDWDGQGAKSLVADRKAQHCTWLRETPADVLSDNGEEGDLTVAVVQELEAAYPMSHPELQPDKKGKHIQGLAVSPGLARGRTRVILHPHEGRNLQTGEILVAPSTDPAWTPLFLRASAIVMETGGYLSHGAIVAREFGIPAVVNIPGLLKIIETGQELQVDGDQGRIRLKNHDPA